MGLKGQSHRGANGRDSGRQTEKKGDETRQRRQWECMFHSRNKRLYELTTIFEERARARARKSERRRFTRGHRTSHVAILSRSPKWNLSNARKSLSSFPFPYRSRLFRTVSYLFCTMSHQLLLRFKFGINAYSFDIRLHQFGLFLTVRMK